MADRDPVEVLAEEFMLKWRRGERPSVEEYARRLPQFEAKVRKTFPLLVLMEQLAEELSSSSAVPASSFGDELVGRVLGDFRILEEVGRGGMGVVYKAEQLSLRRKVALKVLPPHGWLSGKQQKRFEREVLAAAQLHHTNIVPIFGVGEQEGLQFYVMQFIEGPSLAQVLERLRKLQKQKSGSNLALSDHQPGSFLERAFVRTFLGDSVHCPDGSAEKSRLERAGQNQGPAHQKKRSEGYNAHQLDQPGKESRGSREWTPPTVAVSADATSPDVSLSAKALVNNQERAADVSDFQSPEGRPGQQVSSVSPNSVQADGWSFATPDSSGGKPESYWRAVAKLGVQVAEALHYAHSRGIAHRDIKPGNLLVDHNGTVWVTDFGLAKWEQHEEITHTGDVVGTLRYLAPEAFEGRTDFRSDVYGLGLTLYELLTLRPAFDQRSRHQLVRQVLESSPPRPRALNPAVPKDLETIVLKAIEREPAQRYQTAKELADDLSRFLNDRPISARPIGPLERLWRWCRRNPLIAATSSIALSLVLLTAVTAFVLVTREKNAALSLAGKLQRQTQQLRQLLSEKEQLAEKERLARERADQAARQAEAVTDFLLLEMQGTGRKGQGAETTLRTLLDSAARRVDLLLTRPLQQAAVRQTLGEAYLRLGAYKAAEQQLRAALKLRRNELGEGNRQTLTTAAALALTLYHQGKYREGQTLCQRILPKLQKELGLQDLVTLRTQNTLAMLELALGELDKARRLSEQAASLLARTLGENHPDTLAAVNTLAMCLYQSGDYKQAEQLLSDCETKLERLYGPEHPQTLSVLANLAAARHALGHYKEAADTYRLCWERMSKTLGPNHPETLSTEQNLAVTELFCQNEQEAERLLRDVLARRRSTDGEQHWRTANTASQLAACLIHQKKFKQAEPLLLESVRIFKADPDSPPQVVQLALRRLVLLYRKWGKPEKAHQWETQQSRLNDHAPPQKTPKPNAGQ